MKRTNTGQIGREENPRDNRSQVRIIQGQEIAIIRSRNTVSEMLCSRPDIVIIDLDAVVESLSRVISWTCLMREGSRVVLLVNAETEIPVSLQLIDATLTPPLTDEKLQEIISSFEDRDQYMQDLRAYQRCIWDLTSSGFDTGCPDLHDRVTELQTKLADFEEAVDTLEFERTMRYILQRAD